MNRSGIEKALQNAVNSAPDIPFEQIAAQPFIRMQEHDYITRQEEIKKASPVRQFTLAAAFCMVILMTLSGWYFTNKVTDSIIMLDVNPSIEILTNRKDEVLAVKALNEDAQRIIGENDYSGTELNDTVTRLLTTLVESSYINQEKNAILLSVTSRNNKKADNILRQMGDTIKNSLAAQNIQPMILSQIISRKDGSSKLADKYNISKGKLLLIQDMIAFNSKFTLDKLAGQPVEQLLKLARENQMDLSKYLTLTGEAGLPSVTAKPEKNPGTTRDGAANDGKEEDSKLEDDSNSDKEDISTENEDDENQEIEDRNDEDKNEDGDNNYSKTDKGKNRQKEDADNERSDDRSAYTGETEDGSEEDSSYSSGEGDDSDNQGSQWSEEDSEADGQNQDSSYVNQDGYINEEEGDDGNSRDVSIGGNEEDNDSIDTWGDNGYSNDSGSYEDNVEKNSQEDDSED